MKYKLTKLESNHNRLRTDEVVGEVLNHPVVGSFLSMVSEPLTEGATHRFINTSQIQEVVEIDEKTAEFKTRNSNYRLEKL